MTGDYMLLLILCFPFLGAFVVVLLGRGEGAGNDTDRKRKTTADIGAGLVTVSEMLCFAVLFGLFWKGGNEGIRYDFRWEGFCGMGLHGWVPCPIWPDRFSYVDDDDAVFRRIYEKLQEQGKIPFFYSVYAGSHHRCVPIGRSFHCFYFL